MSSHDQPWPPNGGRQPGPYGGQSPYVGNGPQPPAYPQQSGPYPQQPGGYPSMLGYPAQFGGQPGHGAPQPKKRKPWPWLIPLVVVVVAAAVTVPIVVSRSGSSSASPTANQSGNSSNAAPASLEPGVLFAMAPGTGRPGIWGSTAYYDACAILPMSSVIQAGVGLDPALQVFVDRPELNNPGGPGHAQPNAVEQGLSSCAYPGIDDKDQVDLEIYQAPFNSASDFQQLLTYAQESGGQQRSESGFDIYTFGTGEKGEWQAVVLGRNNTVGAKFILSLTKVSYKGRSPQDVINNFEDTVVRALTKPPSAPAVVSYTGAYSTMLDPCQLFTAQDFQSMYNTTDDGRPHAAYQLGEREEMPDPGTNFPAMYYVSTECQRMSPAVDASLGGAAGFIAKFDTYRTDAQAHAGMYDWCDPHSVGLIYGPSTQISTKIGDDQVCFPNDGHNDWFLTFRVGRTIAEIGSWNEIDPSQFPLPQLADALTPAAQAIASRLAGW